MPVNLEWALWDIPLVMAGIIYVTWQHQPFRIWWAKWQVYRFAQVNPKAKCPACGHRLPHKIVFSASLQRVLHQCAFCSAPWTELPVVQTKEWLPAAPVAEPVDEEPRSPFASREPQRAFKATS